MKKNALRKDFFMEIRKSMGRFLSIFLIVALGVIILVGLRATEPDMILSGDTYADKSKLMDIKIVSTYGLTDADVDVVERLPAIESAEGTYSADVLLSSRGNMQVMHVMAKTNTVNKLDLTEGRFPENNKECVVETDFLKASEYEIGDTIQLVSGTSDELTETLKFTELTIVGTANSPLYFSFERGSSTIGNGTVSGFIVVNPQAFALDVYTEIYAMVDDAKEAMSFTEEYDDLVENAIEQIQLIQNVRCEVRKNELVTEAQHEIEKAKEELEAEKEKAEAEISKNEGKLNSAELEIKLGELQLQMGKEQIASGKTELETGKKELESIKSIYKDVMATLEDTEETLTKEISELEKELEDAKEGILGSLNQDTISSLETRLESLKEELKGTEEQIDSIKTEFDAYIADAEKKIADGEKQLAEGEKELNKSENQLNKGQAEINSGKQELENAKNEMNQQITDAEIEIEDAEEEINELELPVWYIFDRSVVTDYKGFGDNAARIAALALVFPSMFFLVAALISLTSMTRMVEEQRVQIGTMKALGYSKLDIMKKYLLYAMAATISGAVVGVLIGEKLLPFIIINAYYNTVYTNIPIILMPYQWGIGILAVVISALCTGVATIASCAKELKAQPAVLMRPVAPQIGKQTFIEKIPFIWRRLSFSWKSSLRNLFRYKKRFFMTLFGIGGCMGLLMVGYGLRDSISSISDLQYGELQLYDCSVYLSEDIEAEERADLETFLKDHNSIDKYINANMQSTTTKYEEEEVDAYLIVLGNTEKSKEFFNFRDRVTKEEYELNDEGIIISEKTAKMLGAEVGDTILLTESGMNERKVEIIAICENYVEHWIYMTEKLYEELYEEASERNSIFVKAEEGTSEKQLNQIGKEILQFEDILNVQYTENMVESIDGMLSALDDVMVILIIIAGMLSFVVLYNLNNINITERRRELATLKVLGFYHGEVAMYVYRENILLTLLGAVVGCIVGKFLHLFTIVTVEVDAAMFGRIISPKSYLICAGFTIGFSIIVNAFMYFKLKSINMVESLKSVE